MFTKVPEAIEVITCIQDLIKEIKKKSRQTTQQAMKSSLWKKDVTDFADPPSKQHHNTIFEKKDKRKTLSKDGMFQKGKVYITMRC